MRMSFSRISPGGAAAAAAAAAAAPPSDRRHHHIHPVDSRCQSRRHRHGRVVIVALPTRRRLHQSLRRRRQVPGVLGDGRQ